MSAAKGILVRPTGVPFRVEGSFLDSSGNPVLTGTATIKVCEIQTDGTLRALDFSTSPPTVGASSATVPTTATLALSNQSAGGGARPYWSAAFGFTNLTPGGVYLVEYQPPAGATTPNPKMMQYGQADSDLALDALGRATLTAAEHALIGGTDVWANTTRTITGAVMVNSYVSGQDPATLVKAGAAPGWYVAPDNADIVAIKVVTDKLATGLQSDGASGYQFTVLAVARAPSGGGGGTDPLSENVPGSYSGSQAGAVLANLATAVAAIQASIAASQTSATAVATC
jgi:hypothetical protein